MFSNAGTAVDGLIICSFNRLCSERWYCFVQKSTANQLEEGQSKSHTILVVLSLARTYAQNHDLTETIIAMTFAF